MTQHPKICPECKVHFTHYKIAQVFCSKNCATGYRNHGGFRTWQERFYSYVPKNVPDNECWLWLGSTHKYGYGQITIDGKSVKAHRLMYELVHGPINNSDLVIMHACDVRRCCNPAHLSLGTVSENFKDMYKKGRNVVTRGETSGMSKLTENQVREIREVRKTGALSITETAVKYGVSKTNIRDIVSRKTWKHVD